MADNPDGAHMHGLNANMIQTIDASENEHLDPLHFENRHEFKIAGKQPDDAEPSVWRACFVIDY